MIKKKDLSQEDKKTWEEYIKDPTDVYDKDINFRKHNRKDRFTFDLHGFSLNEANKKVRAKKPKVKKIRSATGSANNRKTKRRKKVGNSNLKVLSNKSGTKIADKSKQNLA